MSIIENWALAIIGAAFVCTVIEIIAPNGSKQIINLVTGIFMLTVIISPLKSFFDEVKNFKPDIETEYSQGVIEKELIQKMNSYTAESGAEAVEEILEDMLGKFGVENGQVIVNYEIDEENSVINVTSAVIQLDERYKARGNQIETYIYRNSGIPVEVQCE